MGREREAAAAFHGRPRGVAVGRWIAAVTGVGLWLAAGTAAAQSPPRWALNASAATATPEVLTEGLSLGAAAEAMRRLRSGPAFVSARLGWTAASSANDSWVVDHHQFVAAVGAGAGATLGAGRVWAQAGGGASAVYEQLSRHQLTRFNAAGVPGGSQTTLALGPYLFAEAGVAIKLKGAFSGFLAGGPALSRIMVDGSPLWRLGGVGRLGVGYGF